MSLAGGRRRSTVAAVAAACFVTGAALALVLGGGRGAAHGLPGRVAPAREVSLDPIAIARARRALARRRGAEANGHAQVVVAVPPGQGAGDAATPAATGGGARDQSDAEIQRELSQFRNYLATIPPTTGKRAAVLSNGEAAAPFDAPQTVIDVVQAANEIARTPYRWGGGHSAWRDKGYDCSGSVSFALAAAGLLGSPLDSTAFMRYGAAGPGRWITIYANQTHAFMTIAGLRFDTGGLVSGTRWQASMRSTSGFVVRHPPGL
jgi:hypothetical protein